MAVLNVSTAAALTAALAAAKGGDVISLAGGNYGDVSIRDLKPTASIVLRSADAANPAHFDTLTVRTSQNLSFHGLDIGRALKTGEPDFTQMASVRESTKIVFDGNHIHGSLDGNAQNDGYGLFVDTATAITLVDNVFEQLTRGAVVSTVTNLQVSNNKFLDIRSDGLDTDNSKNVVIEGNLFQGFYPLDYDHPDAMQFHNLGATEWMENVTIRNNMLLPGGTGSPQGVWISDPGTTGFKNFVIENNLLWGKGLYNGIGLNGVVGAKVVGNTVLSPTDDNRTMWIRVQKSSDIELTRNVSEDFIIESTAANVRQLGNINLRTSPSTRTLMADPESPEGWADVRLNGVGAFLPVALESEAPVSGAVGTALKGLLAPIGGQSVAQLLTALAIEDEDADLSSSADLVFVAPADTGAFALDASDQHEFFSGLSAGFPGGRWHEGYLEHFVALP